MAGVFVVGLPADDVRIFAVSVGQRMGYPARLLAVGLGRHRAMTPRTVLLRQTIFGVTQGAGIGVCQPFGWGRCRRAKHDFQPCVPERFNRSIQPAPGEYAGFRLHLRPSKFCDAHC